MKGKIAHFLLDPVLATSPPNEAFISAMLEIGYEVDLYAPGPVTELSYYGKGVRAFLVEYGYRWMARNAFRWKWREYRALSGTTEDPMAVVGVLAALHGRRVLTLADEIRTGSNAGNRSARWKALCRSGMSRAALTVVNDEERIPLQRDYAGLAPDRPMLVYPGCFRRPPEPADRASIRAGRNIPEDALVLCYSGVISHGNGGVWLAEALRHVPDLWVWAQIVNLDPLARGLLERVSGAERLVFESERMSWHQSWASMAAVDIGMVVYLQDGPQFQHMGIASNRLCMFLAMGVPVIASRQPSFEFIEKYRCGVLVEHIEDVPAAINTIAADLSQMKINAAQCARDYIDAPSRYEIWRTSLGRVLAP